MKRFLLPAILLCALQSMAQSSDRSPLSLSVAEKLAGDQASFNEVKNTLGKPTQETMSPDNAAIEYNTGNIICRFMFDGKRMLTNVIYRNKSDQEPDLTYEQVKETRKKHNLAEIRKRLGDPTEVDISGCEENWYYRTRKSNTLLVKFDLSGENAVVKKYEFYADNLSAHTSEITSQQADALQKGTSTTKDILEEFGEPVKLRLSDKGEEWLYTSGNTMLMVYFDNQSVMSNYMYRNDSSKEKL
ncbi:hypothetical protein ACTHGU_11120 [Chitinophagaceae bacterium MMS25-I14]